MSSSNLLLIKKGFVLKYIRLLRAIFKRKHDYTFIGQNVGTQLMRILSINRWMRWRQSWIHYRTSRQLRKNALDIQHRSKQIFKAGFTHAKFDGRFSKFSKQTQAKSRLNATTSPIFQILWTVYRFWPDFWLEILKILCRPTKLACVNQA